jgi:hypothetical protein
MFARMVRGQTDLRPEHAITVLLNLLRVTKCLRFSLSRRTVSAEYFCCGTLTWRRSIDGRIYGKHWEEVGNDLGEGGQAHVLRVKDRTGVLPPLKRIQLQTGTNGLNALKR